MVQIFLSELMEDVDLDTFLKEDQATLAKEEGSPLHKLLGSFGTTSNVSVEREKCSPTMSSVMLCSRYIHVFIFISFNPTLIKF